VGDAKREIRGEAGTGRGRGLRQDDREVDRPARSETRPSPEVERIVGEKLTVAAVDAIFSPPSSRKTIRSLNSLENTPGDGSDMGSSSEATSPS
jgi:hypothetical protein